MSIYRNHENAVVVTPTTLKHQIITRINTLVRREGGSYYGTDGNGTPKALTTIEGVGVYGVVAVGNEIFLELNSETDTSNQGEFTSYNANVFYIEQLWDVYMACEPIYSTRFNDYAVMQDV